MDNGDREILFDEEILELYQVRRELGQGAFGKVYECRSKADGNLYAVKVIQKNSVRKSKIDSLRDEAKIMSNMSHPNVVKLYGMHETQDRFYLRMELIQYGTLGKLIRQRAQSEPYFTDDQMAKMMQSILEGVNYLHSINIIHRDLKPCIKLKITDFGLSTQLDSQRSVSLQCGTLIFMAPQILFRYTYTKSVDIYSCSVIMFMLFNRGVHPSYTPKMSPDDYKKKLIHAKFPPLSNELAQNLIDKLSKYESLERYNVGEALKHPWITRRFSDPIPLSIYQSFISFEQTQKTMLMIRASFIFSCFQLEQLDLPDKHAYDRNYLIKCQEYSTASQNEKIRKKSHKKKISSNEQIKQFFGQLEKGKRETKKIQQVYNDKHPKIQKLNSLFSNLFEKKTKRWENKIETMGNLASYDEHTPFQPDHSSSTNMHVETKHCKQKIQQQIEKSVRDFKDKIGRKSRRIFSRNNIKPEIRQKPQLLPAIHSKTVGDKSNMSTNQHDSSFKSSDKVITQPSQAHSKSVRNKTLKTKDGKQSRQLRNLQRKPSLGLKRS